MILNRYRFFGAIAVAAFSGCTIANAQTRPHSCGAIDNVGVESGKPFTAVRVSHSVNHSPDGIQRAREFVEFVARDTAGRIRVEKRQAIVGPHGAERIDDKARENLSSSTVIVFDCPNGKTILMQPDMQIARVKESGTPSPAQSKVRPYSSFYNTLAGRDLPANLTFEDLGTKEIDGITAHGFKTITLGTEEDVEWNGKPIRVSEVWVSDDIAATLLKIDRDFKKKNEGRTTLTNIKREEPEASLFEIPIGYKLDEGTGITPD
jgi:hypothetical protein